MCCFFFLVLFSSLFFLLSFFLSFLLSFFKSAFYPPSLTFFRPLLFFLHPLLSFLFFTTYTSLLSSPPVSPLYSSPQIKAVLSKQRGDGGKGAIANRGGGNGGILGNAVHTHMLHFNIFISLFCLFFYLIGMMLYHEHVSFNIVFSTYVFLSLSILILHFTFFNIYMIVLCCI